MSNVIGAVFSIKDQFSGQIKNILKATRDSQVETKKAVDQFKNLGSSFKDDISNKVVKVNKAVKDTEKGAVTTSRAVKGFGDSFKDNISPRITKVVSSFKTTEQISKKASDVVDKFGKDFNGKVVSERLIDIHRNFEKTEKGAAASTKLISARVSEMNDTFEKTSKKSESVASKLMNMFKGGKVASDADKITNSTKKTEKSFKDTSSAAKSFGENVSGGFKRAASGASSLVTAIGITKALSFAFGLVKGSLDSAFNRMDVMESFERVMTTLTGSAQKTEAALKATSEAVTGTAYGMDVAAKGVQDFVTRGMDIDKATNVISSWGDAVAFYGDGSNAQLESVSDALAKMVSKGKVDMDQMNTLFDAGIDGVGMYAKATNKSTEDVQKGLSSGKITATDFIDTVTTAMMEGTNGVEKIKGAAKEAGASWGASFDNMKAAVARGTISIIKSLDDTLKAKGLPQMREMVSQFGKKFEEVLKKAAEKVPAAIDKVEQLYAKLKDSGAIDTAKTAIESISNIAKDAFDGIADSVKLAADNMNLLIPAIAGVAGAMTAFKVIGIAKGIYQAWSAATTTQTTAQWLLNASMLANPITWVVIGIGALIAAGVALYMNWDKVKAKSSELWSTVKDKFGQIKESMSQAIGSAVDYVKEKFNTFTGFIQSIPEKFASFVSKASAYVHQLPERIAFSVGYMIGYLSTVPARSVAFFLSLRDRAIVAINEMRERVSLSISNMMTRSITYLSALPGRVLAFFSQAKVFATSQANQLARGVVSFVSSLPGKLSSIFSKAVTAVTNGARRMYTGAIDWIKKIPEKITELVGGAIEKVTGLIEKVRKSFSRGFKTSVSVNEVIGPAGIPVDGRHKTGLNRVPFDGYVAELHKDEMVLKKDEANSYRKGNAGNDKGSTTIRESKSATNNITIHINHPVVKENQDIKKIATEIAKSLKKASINSI